MITKPNHKSKNLNQGFTDVNSTVSLNAKPSKKNGNSETLNPQPETRNPQPEHCLAINLGMMDYQEAWKLQGEIVAARHNGVIETDIIFFLEHPTVFTLGRRGGLDHLLVSEEFLKSSGIPIVHVERGGNITFHGPGQLVAYPIVNLKKRNIGVVDFVTALEDVMLATVQTWGIAADRNAANRGIWVGNKKMGSIGLAIRKGISFHGLALNVDVDLTPFSYIQPCGLQGVRMTSMSQELATQLSVDDVSTVLQTQFELVLNLTLTTVSLSDLQRQLKTSE